MRAILSEAMAGVQHSDRPAVPAADGRMARRLRGRAAAVEAVLALFDEGDLRPSADAVVERAGISQASLFRYFDGMTALYRAAFEEQVARAGALARIDGIAMLALDERVRRYVVGRIDVYVSVAGVGRMARARSLDDPAVGRAVAIARDRWLAQTRTVFASELRGRGRADAAGVAAAVDSIASFESWDLLVEGRGLARARVEHLWATAIVAVLAR